MLHQKALGGSGLSGNGCIRETKFSVILNGRPMGRIQTSRRLRLGDPPFLFILVSDGRMLAILFNTIKGFEWISGLKCELG